MRELIERLENATGPDRELGRDVLLACGWRRTCVGNFYGPLWHWSGPGGRSYPEDSLPCPTESIDAALTLAPDNHTIYLTRPNQSAANKSCYACIAPAGLGGPQYAKKRAHLTAFHNSLPIALCIAALRALTALAPTGKAG
jgi:hypothetical protein